MASSPLFLEKQTDRTVVGYSLGFTRPFVS